MKLKVAAVYILSFMALDCLAVGSKRPDAKFFEAQYPGEDRTPLLTSEQFAQESEQAALWAARNYDQLTTEDCRPPIRMGADGHVEVLLGVIASGINGTLGCMFAGHKNLYLGEYEQYPTIPQDIIKTMTDFSIKRMNFTSTDGRSHMILFTPKGYKSANLFAKYVTTQSLEEINDYLYGMLLGYPENDIRAYYMRTNKLKQASGAKPRNFEQDKKDAIEWIEKNGK